MRQPLLLANTCQDFACVDQDNPGAGVSSLPIMIIQCNAVISLVDDTYYDRAWCCVEALMVGELDRYLSRRSVRRWYEHLAVATPGADQTGESEGPPEWTLQPARDLMLSMKDKKLTYEQDRPKVMFLERQSSLLRRIGW